MVYMEQCTRKEKTMRNKEVVERINKCVFDRGFDYCHALTQKSCKGCTFYKDSAKYRLDTNGYPVEIDINNLKGVKL